jgi:hypothetical protein
VATVCARWADEPGSTNISGSGDGHGGLLLAAAVHSPQSVLQVVQVSPAAPLQVLSPQELVLWGVDAEQEEL